MDVLERNSQGSKIKHSLAQIPTTSILQGWRETKLKMKRKKHMHQNFWFVGRWEEEGRGQFLNQGLTWILLLTPVLVPPVGGKLRAELLPRQQELALLRE